MYFCIIILNYTYSLVITFKLVYVGHCKSFTYVKVKVRFRNLNPELIPLSTRWRFIKLYEFLHIVDRRITKRRNYEKFLRRQIVSWYYRAKEIVVSNDSIRRYFIILFKKLFINYEAYSHIITIEQSIKVISSLFNLFIKQSNVLYINTYIYNGI